MPKPKIMIVEDDLELLEALTTTVEIAGFDYIGLDKPADAITVLEQQQVDLVVSDVNMPGMNGFELLKRLQRQHPAIPVILMTAYGQISQAVAALHEGAVDYLVKPFEGDQFIDTIKTYIGRPERRKKTGPVAVDVATQRLFQLAQKVAPTDSTVMISGESGTGKEVLARYIHQNSSRNDGPFIAINCAAIPENMLEATLFGYEKGAFTGAHSSMPGKFEQANGGTILLDEISEMELGLQAKLLRVLQEKEVERLAGRKTIKLDVRVLATTNRDLKHYVSEGRFREDLYYRLSVFPMQWLPLRQRRDDILPLAEHLLAQHSRKMKLPQIRFDESARIKLQSYDWPGNVRELDNVVQRALILQHNGLISEGDLLLEGSSAIPLSSEVAAVNWTAPPAAPPQDDDSGLGQEMKQKEFQIILDTLRSENGRRNKVAEKLGISPRTLRYKIARMREHGIDIEEQLAQAG